LLVTDIEAGGWQITNHAVIVIVTRYYRKLRCNGGPMNVVVTLYIIENENVCP